MTPGRFLQISAVIGFITTQLVAVRPAAASVDPEINTYEAFEARANLKSDPDAEIGERFSPYLGGISFIQTDVSLKGNSDIPVQVSRSITPGDPLSNYNAAESNLAKFGNWTLQIPQITGYVAKSTGWPTNRCTGYPFPPTVLGTTGTGSQSQKIFYRYEYWQGFFLQLPGDGDRALLQSSGRRNQDPNSRLATLDNWNVRCTSQTATLSDGSTAGESFLVISPQGIQYTMSRLIYETTDFVFRSSDKAALYRYRARMLATHVQDRFGNFVDYGYDPNGNLISISASDGRSITLTYLPVSITTSTGATKTVYTVSTIKAGSRIWTYSYDNGAKSGLALTKVIRPDQSTWLFSGTMYPYPAHQVPSQDSCAGASDFNYSITTPYGLIGTYTITTRKSGLANQPGSAVYKGPPGDGIEPMPRAYHCTYALASKTMVGPGFASKTWKYSYPFVAGYYQGGSGSNQTSTIITDPEGNQTQSTYSILSGWSEGTLVSSSVTGLGASTPTMKVSYTYQAGTYIGDPGFTDSGSATQTPLVLSKSINHLGDSYSSNTPANQFDVFGRTLQENISNSLGVQLTKSYTYLDDLSKWILNNPTSIAINGNIVEKTDYTNLLQPYKSYKFGLIKSTFAYNPDGTLLSETDGLQQTTSYSNWKRGIPQSITFTDKTLIEAAVNDDGQISSVKNELSNSKTFTYDPLGRIASITWPTGDTVNWAPTSYTYTRLAVSELGVPAGSWRLRLTEGNHQTSSYVDASANIVLIEDKDISTGSSRYIARSYDSAGRVIFESYPSSTYNSSSGRKSIYDPLGRLISSSTTDGILLSKTSYLAGNRRQVTDADGKVTTISYQALDAPEYNRPTLISAPLNQVTTISRDLFGFIHSINQSGQYQGNSLSVTRGIDYDNYQRPCRRYDPEAGNTLLGYDADNQLAWEIKGQTTVSCQASAPAGATFYKYDSRGRKILNDYPGAADDITFGYDLAGNLISLINSYATIDYKYNKRDLKETEKYQIDGKLFVTSLSYDSIGHRKGFTYPDLLHVEYAPNAFGEPTQLAASCCNGASLGAYASGIQYYPNGLISGYTLGNGLSYSQGLDSFQRPSLQNISNGSTPIQSFSYKYSYAGDLQTLTESVYHVDDASLTYDDLHRLATASGAWGGYTYNYDPLNNIRSRTGANALSYGYDSATNRLTSVSGATNRSYGYDNNGGIKSDGARTYTLNAQSQITSITGLTSYVYDGAGKRIRSQSSGSSGVTEYTIYSSDGSLIFSQSSGTSTDYLQLGGKEVVQVANNTPLYLHADLLGSPRMATNNSRQIIWNEHFDPYGAKLNGVNEKIGYTGHAYDASTGLTYAQARFYDSAIGRFLSIDPSDFSDSNPFSFNRYSYGNNNPYKNKDPDGKIIVDALFVAYDVYTLVRDGATATNLIALGLDTASTFGFGFGAGEAYRGAQAVADARRLAGETSDVAKGISESVNSSRGGASVVRVGQAGEAAVKAVYDIGNKGAISVNGRTRIPDGLTDAVLSEVKNTESVSFTQQLRDFAQFAKDTNRRFDLYVRSDAKLSGPLLDAEAAGDIRIIEIPH